MQATERIEGSWNAILTICAAIGAAVIYIVPTLIYFVFAVAIGQIDPRHPLDRPDPLLIAQVLTYIPVGIYLAVVTPALAGANLRELGFRALTGRDLLYVVGGIVAMYLVVNVTALAAQTITHRQDTEQAVQLLKMLTSPGEKVMFFTIAVVLAPMIEEFLFRVFLFNAIRRYAPLALAAVLSGLAFGAVHSSAPSELLTIGLPLGLGGVVLAYVYAETKNYWASVIVHAVFNAISVVAIVFFKAT